MSLIPEQDLLQCWDSKIRNVCVEVNGIVDQIAALHPKWVAESLDEQMVH